MSSFFARLRDVSVSGMPTLVFEAEPTNELKASPSPPDTFSPPPPQKAFTQALSLKRTADAPFCPNMRMRLVRVGSPAEAVSLLGKSSAKPIAQKREAMSAVVAVFLVILR
jgi:hypothetical protein